MSAAGSSRGARGRAYTLLTPANRYASRLPNLSDALLFKLITPRLSPARFGEYVVAMAAGGGTVDRVARGFAGAEPGQALRARQGAYEVAGGAHVIDASDGFARVQRTGLEQRGGTADRGRGRTE